MTEKERAEIKRLMENEAAEWAVRECVKRYREEYMGHAMKVRAYYESMINVGFREEEALALTLRLAYK